jgi:prevent-host-death family protein
MKNVSLTEAKARLSRLVELAAAGEIVVITRHGKPVAQIAAAEPRRKPIDVTSLRALTDSMPMQQKSASVFVRKMRDQERY